MAESPCQRTSCSPRAGLAQHTEGRWDLHFTSTRVPHRTWTSPWCTQVRHPVYRCLCSHTRPGCMPGLTRAQMQFLMSVSKRVPVLVANSSVLSNPTSLPTCTSPALKNTVFSTPVTKRQATQLKIGKGSEWTVLQRRNKNAIKPTKR